ncbi:SprB repeat-containing protein, partial [Chryseosolibacter indicus]
VQNSAGLLPSSNSITLSVPENHNGFVWKYNIQGTGLGWQNCPALFGTGNSITFSGESLLGGNAMTYLFYNIVFKAVYECESNRETAEINLWHLPSAPFISDIESIEQSCAGITDAALKIKFGRPLYSNEQIRISLKKSGSSEPALTYDRYPNNLDAYNSLVISNLEPHDYYDISLNSFYYNTNTNNLDAGYSDGKEHRRSAKIPARAPISNFNASPSNVHCHAGEDGKITVSAQGGTSSYTAYLLQDGIQLTSISLTNTASSSFTDLKKGTYNVKLKDSNGCDPKDQNGNVITLQPVVNEPAKDIILTEIENIEPLGFGLKNGHVTVQAQEGTLAYTFSWVDKESGELLPSDAPIQQGPTMLNTLPNIGKGIYRVTVKDANYALAYPQIEKNISGCYDTMTFFVTEPPLLEVYLDEYHYVSCNGYTDGELVAHAKGGRPFLFGHEDHPYQYEWFILDENNSPFAFGDSDSIATERPSAWYRLRVTDRNGIQAWSPDYQLIQPDLLVVNFNTSELRCNGDNNAMSKALVAGGTTPYKYAWSTEETTSEISNLTEGWYSVVIKDIRGCTTYGQTQVKVPNSIEATAIVDNPTCEDYKDGSITLDVKGGVRPYAYEWNHGVTSEDVFDLEEGSYNVKISDANNCFILRDFVLKDPELFALTLGPDRKLCRDQFLELDVALTDIGAQYNWTRNNNPFSNLSTVKLEEAGTYHVKITDSNGCSNEDEIVIQREDVEIDANIVVATRAPQGGKVRVANISHPASDNVEWIIPEEAIVLEETSGYVDISFASKGEYSIGLTGFKGGCEKTVYSVVRIVDKNELTDYTTPDEPYIKQFIVKPNPNNGRFSVEVELREAADFKVLFHTAQGSIIREEQIRQQSTAIIEFNVASQVSRGVHLLQLITTQGYATFKIVIE